MSQRIVLFESHVAFAEELREGFAALGIPLDVFDDPNVGVDSAAANPPSLILLTVELAQMNGFLVCKKIKKTPGIDATPLIILSSDPNADEIFEQHKKLRTRADDYLKKPIDFETVLAHARGLVRLEAARGSVEVDAEIDAFADDAFGSLVAEEPRAAEQAPVEADVRASTIDVEEELTELEVEGEAEVEMGRETFVAEKPASVAPPMRERSVPPPPSASVSLAPAIEGELRSQISRLESELSAARSEANVVPGLRAQVAELTAKASKSGGVSSRDYLDLREALNAKDKEILDVRDSLSARDKQLIDLRDQNLVHARAKADLDDRILELETALTGATRQLEVAAADRDSSTKRHEDLKSRFERSEAKLRKTEEDFETAKATHAAESAAAREKHAATLSSTESRHAAAIAAAAAAAMSEKDGLLASHADALAQAEARRESELAGARDSHAAELAAARAAHDESVAAKMAEHAAASAAAAEAAASDKASALAALVAEQEAIRVSDARAAGELLASELASARDAHANALATREGELATKFEGERRLAEDDHARQLALLGRKLADTEGRASTAEASLAESQSKVADLESKHADSESRNAQKARQIEELEQQTEGLGAELSNKLADIENMRTEADALRATIAAVEQVAGDRSARIDTLESERARLLAELEAARLRIASDSAVIERVHRALSIGLGLLEEQKQTAAAAE